MKEKVVFFFGYSWAKPQKLDAYQQSIANEFSKQGYDVRVYYANLFSKSDGIYGVFPAFEKKIIKEIKKYQPAIVFSMNFGLLSNAVCDSLPEQTKIFTWIVDDIDHLFRPNAQSINETKIGKIHHRIVVYTFSSAIYNFFKSQHPELDEKKLIFSASVTDPDFFKTVKPATQRNIVFIGSYVDESPVIRLMHSFWRRPEMRDWILRVLTIMEENYEDDRLNDMLSLPMIKDLLSLHKINSSQLKMLLSNLISSNRRIEMTNVLNPLGIEIFGNNAWIDGLARNLSSLKCFQAESISTREDLVRIYQTSKIAIQVPQIQIGGALSYRVFDIMASSALLIHPFHLESDLYHYFGKDCPVPTYKNNKELYELCDYYLKHEEERLEIVRQCNALVEKNFSFKKRISEMLGVFQGQKNEIGTVSNIYSKRSEISKCGTILYAFDIFMKNPFLASSLLLDKFRRVFSARVV